MPEQRWEGGRIRWDSRDRPTYYIQRMVNGRQYDASTRAHSLRAALDHLKRFEADPDAYDARGSAGVRDPIRLNAELSKAFLAWSKEKGNTKGWRGKQKAELAWWADRLGRADLRRATLRDHILPALKEAPGYAHKIRVLKTLYTYLRTVTHAIATAEDPTYGQLVTPQAKPAQWKKSKVIPGDHYAAALAHLSAPWSDALLVQGGTGWHTTEVVRFAAGGAAEPVSKSARQKGAAGVLVCPLTKGGETLRVKVPLDVFEAAGRLLEHGAISREWYDRAVRAACKAAKITPFSAGRLRHSVASWAIDSGADPAMVAAFLGHKSPRTTRRFYATHAVPSMVPTLATPPRDPGSRRRPRAPGRPASSASCLALVSHRG